ncbi:helix-turn-helix domain-containing protein [Bacillota bacterium Meth-B3]|nr:helix-turn-helix transcriptional regulator [Christensenellaceae bacterium]MEA5066219.1 helix-turn-helix transcriptional regulator [Eubacteriales bacterium]MEA5068794.1 helix-turn-helix transcriptional regulator [Christensenellaceae bacterium]
MNLRLRDLREDGDKTQMELAAYLHVRQSTYSGYESGKCALSLAAADKLADYYGTSVDYLIGRTDERTPYPGSRRPKL